MADGESNIQQPPTMQPAAGVASAVPPALTRTRRRYLHLSVAVFCVFTDYVGLGGLSPVLPYHLAGNGTMTEDAAALWTGTISSVQFAGVVVACLFWGIVSDRFGSHRALRATMVGDAAFFTASAFTRDPHVLLVLRLAVGFSSPLVPAMTYIFAALPASDAVMGSSFYAFSVILGFAAGNGLAASYSLLRWRGIAITSGALCAVALLLTLLLPPPKGGGRKRADGVVRCLRSPNFITQAASTFCFGFYFNGTQALVVADLFTRFGFSAAQAALVCTCVPACWAAGMVAGPFLSQRFSIQAVITSGFVLNITSCVLLSIPSLNASTAALVGLFGMGNLALAFQHIPNTARLRHIGTYQTKNGMGTISGASRLIWAGGQALGPVASLGLYSRLSVASPWACYAILQALVLCLYPLLGVRLLADPAEWHAAPRANTRTVAVGGVEDHVAGT